MRPALARRLLLMTLLLVSLTLFATTLGAMRLPLVNLLPSGDDMLRHIWLTIRLPRVLLALLVGAALALSGCVMQGLFRNPLADPGLLGISSGAALAVASWLVLPFSAAGLIALYMPMLAAFIGSLAVMVVIFILSRAEEGSLSRLLLVGIAINALCGALVGVLSWLSNDAQLRQLSLWGMGSLGQAEWPTLLVAATLIIPAALAVWWMASRLNLLQLGDEEAHYLGVNVQALQRWLLLCSAVLVAVAVAISVYRPGGAAPDAPVAGTGPSRTDPRLAAGRRDPASAGRHPGPHRGGAGGDTGRSAHQPAGRPLVSVAGLSSGELQTWLMNTAPRGCHFTLVNDRLSTTSPSRCAAAR